MPDLLAKAGTDASSTTIAKTIPIAAGRLSASQTANVRAAKTAAIKIPTMQAGFPALALRKRNPLARIHAPVGLAGVYVQRRSEDWPAVPSREALRRLSEWAEPGSIGLAGRAGRLRNVLAFNGFRVPTTFT